MKIKLTNSSLSVDGYPCSSVTVTKIKPDLFQVTMFDNPRYMKKKIKHKKYFGSVEVTIGRRHTIKVRKVIFEGLKPRKQIGEISAMFKRQGRDYFYVENGKTVGSNYINYYELIKV